MGMLFRRELVTFGPREVLLTSEEPVVAQFLSGRREGPIGMSEEKDAATLAAEAAGARGADAPREIIPQLEPSPGLPPRRAVTRRKDRVLGMLDRLPPAARTAIAHTYAIHASGDAYGTSGGPGTSSVSDAPATPTARRTPSTTTPLPTQANGSGA